MVFAGPSGQTESVSSISGIDVDGYVVTGFEGFEAIVDELGGLNFIAPEAMDSHLSGGQVKKGYNHLDGREALAWSRERKSLPGGDFYSLSLIHISEPTRLSLVSRMPSSA